MAVIRNATIIWHFKITATGTKYTWNFEHVTLVRHKDNHWLNKCNISAFKNTLILHSPDYFRFTCRACLIGGHRQTERDLIISGLIAATAPAHRSAPRVPKLQPGPTNYGNFGIDYSQPSNKPAQTGWRPAPHFSPSQAPVQSTPPHYTPKFAPPPTAAKPGSQGYASAHSVGLLYVLVAFLCWCFSNCCWCFF